MMKYHYEESERNHARADQAHSMAKQYNQRVMDADKRVEQLNRNIAQAETHLSNTAKEYLKAKEDFYKTPLGKLDRGVETARNWLDDLFNIEAKRKKRER